MNQSDPAPVTHAKGEWLWHNLYNHPVEILRIEGTRSGPAYLVRPPRGFSSVPFYAWDAHLDALPEANREVLERSLALRKG